MSQRLFQDASGTLPAVLAGQPVGLIKRLGGSVDGTQTAALAKPILARQPRTGIRNLANGAQAVTDGAYWPLNSTAAGLTITRVGQGMEDGIPYADIRYSGTASGGGTGIVYAPAASRNPLVAGQSMTARFTARIIAGSLPTSPAGSRGLRSDIAEILPDGDFVRGSQGAPHSGTSDAVLTHTRVLSGADGASFCRTTVNFSVLAGDVIDVTFRIKGLQFERGDVPTPLQFNYGPNNITEAGVADLWHLYNDGGDSLNVTLPTGSYGLASININRAITVTTITSDGTTPINTLRHARQLDVILREGAFSDGEERAIRDYWGRVFA